MNKDPGIYIRHILDAITNIEMDTGLTTARQWKGASRSAPPTPGLNGRSWDNQSAALLGLSVRRPRGAYGIIRRRHRNLTGTKASNLPECEAVEKGVSP